MLSGYGNLDAVDQMVSYAFKDARKIELGIEAVDKLDQQFKDDYGIEMIAAGCRNRIKTQDRRKPPSCKKVMERRTNLRLDA